MRRGSVEIGRRSEGRGRRGRLAPWPVVVGLALAASGCAGGAGGPAGAPSEPDPTVARADTAAVPPDTARGSEGAEPDSSDHRPVDPPDARALEQARMRAAVRRDSVARAARADSIARADSLARAEAAAAGPPAPLPVPILPGALLPRQRIVAFYGNPASERMGILGELPPDEMLARLDAEIEAWREADPATPVRPALQMIAVMATGDPGRDSLYRLRMPDSRIRTVSEWADRRDALLILDVQPGRSSVQDEVDALIPWLKRPDVHLALDPEWAMPPDGVPGQQIGSMTAEEINYAIEVLADLVEQYHLPPKLLVVHRFTTAMIENAQDIRRDPRVQVVINMDGWGTPAQKRAAYRDIVAPEADQFTGFKLFFHNDRRNDSVLLTPPEILELDPEPVYIQYQ